MANGGIAAAAPEKRAVVYLLTEQSFRSVLLEPTAFETEIEGNIVGDDGNAIALMDSSDRLQIVPWNRIRKIVYKQTK